MNDTVAAYIKLVDALNTMEELGLPTMLGYAEADLEVFNGAYTLTWDGAAARWTLVSETDDAPDLCPFNRVMDDDCSVLEPCDDCTRVQVALEDTGARVNAYHNR